MFAQIDAMGWSVIVTAAVAAIGSVVLQALQMILTYLREQKASATLKIIEKQTNGDMTKSIAAAAAEVVEKVAEKTAENLFNTAKLAAETVASAAKAAAVAVADKRGDPCP